MEWTSACHWSEGELNTPIHTHTYIHTHTHLHTHTHTHIHLTYEHSRNIRHVNCNHCFSSRAGREGGLMKPESEARGRNNSRRNLVHISSPIKSYSHQA